VGVFTVLLSYFDLGVSYGLSDRVFDAAARRGGEIGMVGLDPPAGHGVRAEVPAAVVDEWRAEAARQAHRDVMETGRTGDRGRFDAELAELARSHPIPRCELIVYAVGTVLVELWLDAGIPEEFEVGLPACFEFAGYRPRIARALHSVAVGRVAEAMDARSMASPLTQLTRRELGSVSRDPSEQDADGAPYEEQLLMRSFTTLLVCTEPEDAAALPETLERLDEDPQPVIPFEYHGQIRCGWALTAVIAKRVATPDDPGEDAAEDQIKRMVECVRIAQLFYGTCEAFERLFVGEIDEQVDGYLRHTAAGRPPDELNRLRNLALAIVSLTRFANVTETQEDQRYFAWFEGESKLQSKRDFIRDAADMLYNVSDAETQSTRSRREIALNAIVLLLTSATLLSVSADLYDFVRAEEPLIGARVDRLEVVLESLIVLALIATVTTYVLLRPHPLRRRRTRRNWPLWEGLNDPTQRPPKEAGPT
jgi:hypothetical protein